MIFKNALIISFLSVAFLFQGCMEKNPEIPEIEKHVSLVNKLKNFRFETDPNTGTDYYYDANGLIERTDILTAGKVVGIDKSTYKDGLLISTLYNSVATFSGAPSHTQKHTFKYSGNLIIEVLIEKQSTLVGTDLRPEVHTFSYDTRGFVKMRRVEYIRNGVKELFRIDRFTTDDKGNLIKRQKDTYIENVLSSTSVELREYDQKVNPFYMLLSPLVPEEYFSPNNVTKLTYVNPLPGNSPTTYSYEYNLAGLPVKVRTDTDVWSYVMTREYYK
jgi:hypothetical protein